MMDVALSPRCPLFDDQHHLELMAVIRGVVLGWHSLATPSPTELENLLPAHSWQTYGVLLAESAKTAVYAPHLYQPTDCQSCDPAALADLLGQPAVLIVENPATDGQFIIEVSSRLRPRLYRRLAGPKPSIVVAHGAGIGEIPKEIRRYVSALRSNAYVPGLPRRVVAISDSDARCPGKVSTAATAVTKAANDHGIDHWVLAMRSIENYIPDEALRSYAATRKNASSAVEVVVALPLPARDHYPVKDGLPGESERTPDEATLYGTGIPPEMGVGDFIGDFFENFPHLLVRHELQARDHQMDLEKMLDTIERNV